MKLKGASRFGLEAAQYVPIQSTLRGRAMARDDMMVVMSAHNECVEYQRIHQAYEDAIVVWEQDRHPNVRPINRQKLTNEEAAELRSQALLKRNIAANDLYIHLKTCPTCNHFRK